MRAAAAIAARELPDVPEVVVASERPGSICVSYLGSVPAGTMWITAM